MVQLVHRCTGGEGEVKVATVVVKVAMVVVKVATVVVKVVVKVATVVVKVVHTCTSMPPPPRPWPPFAPGHA